MQASGRTNELDVNAVVTHETFNFGVFGKATSFQAFRTPEYTRDGQTAMNRNVKYSDGTMVGGSGTGTILDGVPGQNASYTGYHWTKAVCETCGTGMCGGCRLTVGGETKFACVDGPDFDGHLVDFDSAMRRGAMYKAQERAAIKRREEHCNLFKKEVK